MTSGTFTARIRKCGINPCIDIPHELISKLNIRKSPVNVVALINNHRFRSTIVRYLAKYIMYLNAEMRKTIGKDTGDKITVEIIRDYKKKEIHEPRDLVEELKNHPGTWQKFLELNPSRRKDICLYINSLKTPAARMKNINKVMDMLNQKDQS